jgi:lipopolysaccharide biosynthesis glycosyltransferase
VSKSNVIALATDGRQMPAAVFAAHRLAEINPRSDVRIVIFSDSLSDIAVAKEFGPSCELMMIEFDRGGTKVRMPDVSEHISGASLFRFFLPGLLGDEVERIAYVDVDTYVEDPVFFRLFDLDMKGHAIAAVRCLLTAYARGAETEKDLARAGCQTHRKYLNAGVLLIDRRRYAERALDQRFFGTAMQLHANDQVALNRVLSGNWQELSPAFNMPPFVNVTFVGAVCKPVVTHFVGRNKPWLNPAFSFGHPIYAEMTRFFAASPWKAFLGQPVDVADKAQRASRVGRPGRTADPLRRAVLEMNWSSLPPTTDYGAVANYLRHTRFADVEQGLTRMDLAGIPATVGGPLSRGARLIGGRGPT